MQILVAKNGSRVGPYSEDEIFARLSTAELLPTDLGWHEGLPAWIPLSRLVGSDNPVFFAPHVPFDVPEPVTYAGFWRRAAAILIDVIVVTILAFPIGFVFGMVVYAAGMAAQDMEAFGRVLGSVISWLYFAIMESSQHQGTFGKMAVGIKVTDENGGRISFGRATGRYFGKAVSALSLGIGFIVAGFTKRKQALHDLMAHCLVVCR